MGVEMKTREGVYRHDWNQCDNSALTPRSRGQMHGISVKMVWPMNRRWRKRTKTFVSTPLFKFGLDIIPIPAAPATHEMAFETGRHIHVIHSIIGQVELPFLFRHAHEDLEGANYFMPSPIVSNDKYIVTVKATCHYNWFLGDFQLYSCGKNYSSNNPTSQKSKNYDCGRLDDSREPGRSLYNPVCLPIPFHLMTLMLNKTLPQFAQAECSYIEQLAIKWCRTILTNAPRGRLRSGSENNLSSVNNGFRYSDLDLCVSYFLPGPAAPCGCLRENGYTITWGVLTVLGATFLRDTERISSGSLTLVSTSDYVVIDDTEGEWQPAGGTFPRHKSLSSREPKVEIYQ
ncbi:4443_t:CDS:2 [Acaulospora colombiana]|uniref:4443_t:CDS:1 n=1 Tax=Acaulospora colombiana TaxID=27376 RepID=A0ACA9N9U8_9GLOM|nr:4443_t:CDS:2 [Acaulospora colombiana]